MSVICWFSSCSLRRRGKSSTPSESPDRPAGWALFWSFLFANRRQGILARRPPRRDAVHLSRVKRQNAYISPESTRHLLLDSLFLRLLYIAFLISFLQASRGPQVWSESGLVVRRLSSSGSTQVLIIHSSFCGFQFEQPLSLSLSLLSTCAQQLFKSLH